MAWIELHQTLPNHKKTSQFRRNLKIKKAQAVGHLCMLWLWALDSAPDGNLTGFAAEDIAEAAGWAGKSSQAFVDALQASGYIDSNLRLHDWNDYAGRLIDKRDIKREQDKIRQQRRRDKLKSARDDNENVTRDEGVNHAPYRTQPYPTQPNRTSLFIPCDQEINKLSCGGGGEEAGARGEPEKAVDDYLANRNLIIDRYFGATEQIKAENKRITDAIFSRLTQRQPTEQDAFRVFEFSHASRQSEDGSWEICFPKDRVDLLLYAFEQATTAGRAGNWNYIEGCMKRMAQRGIKTLAEAEDFDCDFERG